MTNRLEMRSIIQEWIEKYGKNKFYVKGLYNFIYELSPINCSKWEVIRSILKELGYRVTYKVDVISKKTYTIVEVI